jgi:hypothetical protein
VTVPKSFQTQSPAPLTTPSANQPISFWFLTASILLYLSFLVFGILRNYPHLHVVLLVLQYLVILPAALRYLGRQHDRVQEVGSIPRLNLWVTIGCFALLALPLSWFSSRGLLNPDESGYTFQARIYSSGRIMADPLIGATSRVKQTPLEIFYNNHVLRPYGWFPKFPPGWPLVLSLAYVISAPWLLSPIFGVLQLLVIAALGSQCFSRPSGLIAAFFAVLSPFYLVNSIGMMSHAWCALLAATACLALFRALVTESLWYYAGMFACLAATLQVRPYTGFVVTTVLTAAAVLLNRKRGRVLVRILAVGAFFGTIAVAGVLIYNHLYTGDWFVSPYALAAGSHIPPELTFDPIKILRGMRNYAGQAVEGNLIGTFPFAYLLAGYALFKEREHRNEVWILASIYGALVLAYLAHPDGYAVFFGERFHFEAFFALLLLAARGFQLLVEGWRTPHRALAWAALLFAVMQATQQCQTVATVARRGEPYRKVREAVAASNPSGLVLLHDGPGFDAKHLNLNAADWRHARTIYLVDAEPEHRDEWACRYGVPEWTVVTYDAQWHRAILKNGKADCGISPTERP